MLFWLLLSILVVIFAYFGDEVKNNNRVLLLCSRICLVLTLSIVVATCGSVFSDHEGYRSYYYYLSRQPSFEYSDIIDFIFGKSLGSNSFVENGFSFLTWILGRLSLSHIGYFFILGLLTNLFLVETFYRFKYPAITFFIFITTAHFSQEMNLIRQMIVVSAIACALVYVEKHKWGKFLFCVSLPFLIHQSVLVGILFLPLCFVTDYKRFWSKFKLVIMPFYIISILIALKFINFDLSSYFDAFDMYQGYLNNENNVGTKNTIIDIPYNLLAILCLLLYRGGDSKVVYAFSFIVGAIFINLSVQTPNFMRIALFFSIIYSAFVPEMLGDFKNKRLKGISMISMYLLILYHCALITSFILSDNYIGTKVESIFDFF